MGADYGIDIDEVRRVIDAAEVLVVRFAITDKRLLVDARTNGDCGPMLRAVPKAGSVEERFRALKILRPRFKVPERILTFEWPRHVRTLVDAGLWDHLVRRLAALGWPDIPAQCEEAYRLLVEDEASVERAAVAGGAGFQTLWPARIGTDG